jgi:hypothetical protein
MNAAGPYRNPSPPSSTDEDEIPNFRDLRPFAWRHGWRAVMGTSFEATRLVARFSVFVLLGIKIHPAFFATVPLLLLIAFAYTKLGPALARRRARAVECEADAWLASLGGPAQP